MEKPRGNARACAGGGGGDRSREARTRACGAPPFLPAPPRGWPASRVRTRVSLPSRPRRRLGVRSARARAGLGGAPVRCPPRSGPVGARGPRPRRAAPPHLGVSWTGRRRCVSPHGPGRGRPASRRGDEDLPAAPASLAAAAGRLHCLTTAWARLSADLQVQETSRWKIRELPLQDRKKENQRATL